MPTLSILQKIRSYLKLKASWGPWGSWEALPPEELESVGIKRRDFTWAPRCTDVIKGLNLDGIQRVPQ